MSDIRNPHGDFHAVEAKRPDFPPAALRYSKAAEPGWTWGDGGNDGGASLAHAHVEIDPHAPGRPPSSNYTLLISSIVPRPIGFLSTVGTDGSTNLAPFSYTNVVNHDPPIFTVGIAGGLADAKDTLANLAATRECVLNIVSEHFVEAANATAVPAPYGASEWALSGLHPAAARHVRPARVREAVVAVECRVVELREFDSRAHPGRKSGTLVLLEGIHFWVREDALDAEQRKVDPAVLRPVARMGGITYARATDVLELPRPPYDATAEAVVAAAGKRQANRGRDK